jgi:hypothetical protein
MSAMLRVLELLECFRFLTREQMHRAGLECNADHLGDVLRNLDRRRLVGVVRPGVAPGVGRIPFVYYLRKPGAELLAETSRRDLEALTWCEGTPQLTHDLAHRLACVDVHLWLVRVLGGSLASFWPYYTMTKTADGMRHSSRLVVDGRAFVPDALFIIEKGQERFGYVLEVQRAKRSGQLSEQLAKHAHAVREKIAAQRLGVDAVAVMFVVEQARDLKVLRGAAATIAPLRGVLFGRTLASLGATARFSMDEWEALA